MRLGLLAALLAGALQGVGEWLPVSSKTLVALLLTAMGLPLREAYVLGLVANAGSFVALLSVFRRELRAMLQALRHPLAPSADAQLLRFVVVAKLATGLVGIPLYLWTLGALASLSGPVVMLGIGCLLLVTALAARSREARLRGAARGEGPPRLPDARAALTTGILQGFAVLPGVSRSGMTIPPLLWFGLSGEEALRLSFLLDVVALLGAGVVPLLVGHGARRALAALGAGDFLVMTLTSAVVSLLTIGGVLSLARRLRTSRSGVVDAPSPRTVKGEGS